MTIKEAGRIQANINRHVTPAGAPAHLPLVELSYDYDQIAEEHRHQVRAAAVEIKRSAQTAQENLLEIGKRLLEVKEVLPHGQFEKWIAAEFDLSDRMAQRMMNVAQVYGSNPTPVSLFSPSALYLLAAPSTPEEARAEIEAEAQATGKSPSKTRTLEVIQAHKPPLTQHPGVWKIEQALKTWLSAQRAGDNGRIALLYELRDERARHAEWLSLWDVLPLGKRKGDVLQAINNVLDQMRRRAAPPKPSPAVGLEPPGTEGEFDEAALPLDLSEAGYRLQQLAGGWRWGRKLPDAGVEVGAPGSIITAIDDARRRIVAKAAAMPAMSLDDLDVLGREIAPWPLDAPDAVGEEMADPLVDAPQQLLPAPGPVSAEVAAANAAKIVELRRMRHLFRDTLGSLSKYGELTGCHTDTLPVQRGLETMLHNVESNLAALTTPNGDDQ